MSSLKFLRQSAFELLSAHELPQGENAQFRGHISGFLNMNMRMGLLAELGQRESTKVAKILSDVHHESREGAFKVLLLPTAVSVGEHVKDRKSVV